MYPKITIINPLEYPEWDKQILASTNSSFFLSSSWARVLYESYHYKPLYFTIIKENNISTLIPCMEVRSPLTGNRGVCLPFTDYCEPINETKEGLQGVITEIIAYGKNAGWKTIELRSGSCLSDDFPASCFYYGHSLDISLNEKQIFSNFRDSTKRNIKKAEKAGVAIKILNSIESVKEFYRMNCMTRKEHGLPPQPFYFFNKIYEHIFSKKQGIVVLAEHKNNIIAGAVYFHFGDKVIYKYGASDKNHQNLRANNLVMWEAIRWYSQNGYKEFCFGRTEPDNDGLLQFKRGWGTEERIINYYKYDLKSEVFIKESSKGAGLSGKIFNKIPIPLLKITGTLLYRHVG